MAIRDVRLYQYAAGEDPMALPAFAGPDRLRQLLLIVAWQPGGVLAEEPVKAMAFFNEPLVLSAVPGKHRHLLVVLPQPGLSSPVYALKGMVRYEGVAGDAYLQMNNDFGDKGTFFTRSLAPSGPLGKITGDSDWRPFVLPFYADRGEHGGEEPPREVTLALHLPAAGTVSIREVRLYQYAAGEDPMAATGFAGPDRLRQLLLILVLGLLFVSALVVLIRRSGGGRTPA